MEPDLNTPSKIQALSLDNLTKRSFIRMPQKRAMQSFVQAFGIPIEYGPVQLIDGYATLSPFIEAKYINLYKALKKKKIDLGDPSLIKTIKKMKKDVFKDIEMIYDLFGIESAVSLLQNYLDGDRK